MGFGVLEDSQPPSGESPTSRGNSLDNSQSPSEGPCPEVHELHVTRPRLGSVFLPPCSQCQVCGVAAPGHGSRGAGSSPSTCTDPFRPLRHRHTAKHTDSLPHG